MRRSHLSRPCHVAHWGSRHAPRRPRSGPRLGRPCACRRMRCDRVRSLPPRGTTHGPRGRAPPEHLSPHCSVVRPCPCADDRRNPSSITPQPGRGYMFSIGSLMGRGYSSESPIMRPVANPVRRRAADRVLRLVGGIRSGSRAVPGSDRGCIFGGHDRRRQTIQPRRFGRNRRRDRQG